MILWLLLQAAEPAAADPPIDPLATLRGTVVKAIRNCGMSTSNEIVACSPDRGFAEGERLPKLKKPKPVGSGAGDGIKLQVTAGPRSADPPPAYVPPAYLPPK